MDGYVLDDRDKHKIYPFYKITSFKFNGEYDGYESGYLIDSYTGEVDTGNGSYYGGYMIFHSATDIRYSCNHPKNLPFKCMDFHAQVYGYHEPITFPGIYKRSLVHVIAFDLFASNYNGYLLRKFQNKHLSIADVKSIFGERANLNCFGGSMKSECFEGMQYAMSGKIEVTLNNTKETFTFKLPQLVTALNDILNTTHQLSLF